MELTDKIILQQAKEVGDVLGVTWEKFDVKLFRKGLRIL